MAVQVREPSDQQSKREIPGVFFWLFWFRDVSCSKWVIYVYTTNRKHLHSVACMRFQRPARTCKRVHSVALLCPYLHRRLQWNGLLSPPLWWCPRFCFLRSHGLCRCIPGFCSRSNSLVVKISRPVQSYRQYTILHRTRRLSIILEHYP